MREVYLDRDFRCHITNDGTMMPVKVDFFADKCDSFIEGYRVIPSDYTWIRSDGRLFRGEVYYPWKPYSILAAAQSQYEREKLADAENALAILLGGEV